MKFRNNTGGPIYVQTFVSDNKFHVRLFGTQPVQSDVAIESRILSSGTRRGTTSEAYRIVQTPSGERRERLSRDHYRPKKH
jgi:hypothetical protein